MSSWSRYSRRIVASSHATRRRRQGCAEAVRRLPQLLDLAAVDRFDDRVAGGKVTAEGADPDSARRAISSRLVWAGASANAAFAASINRSRLRSPSARGCVTPALPPAVSAFSARDPALTFPPHLLNGKILRISKRSILHLSHSRGARNFTRVADQSRRPSVREQGDDHGKNLWIRINHRRSARRRRSFRQARACDRRLGRPRRRDGARARRPWRRSRRHRARSRQGAAATAPVRADAATAASNWSSSTSPRSPACAPAPTRSSPRASRSMSSSPMPA